MTEMGTPVGDLSKSPASVVVEIQQAILTSLDLEVDNFEGIKEHLVEVKIKPNSIIFLPSALGGFVSQYREEYGPKGNVMHWSDIPADCDSFRAFILCASTILGDPGPPILHLSLFINDVDAGSIGIRLTDVEEISIYPDNAAEMLNMYQEAEMDGDTLAYNEIHGLNGAPVWKREEIQPYLTDLWPDPDMIFQKSDFV
ncbi:MAG TPA: hypothetical protein VMR34_04685 [Candidatus Saccharimonadales bacterium]|nr:hypothetical protein [Candidatus Saccharimonadales bacterium]